MVEIDTIHPGRNVVKNYGHHDPRPLDAGFAMADRRIYGYAILPTFHILILGPSARGALLGP
jgi:hypothetical protein